jgi:hypothetical protein
MRGLEISSAGDGRGVVDRGRPDHPHAGLLAVQQIGQHLRSPLTPHRMTLIRRRRLTEDGNVEIRRRYLAERQMRAVPIARERLKSTQAVRKLERSICS